MPKLIMDELIGLNVTIKKSTQRGLINVKGRIIDETQRTFTIETQTKEIKVPKEHCTFEFETPEKQHTTLEGKALMARPEERIKKHWRQFNAKHNSN